MAINPYSPCPCGSGKKLKFCCGDLATEIEKVYQMIQGDQPRGALKHIEQLLAKNPDQGTLLDLKASLEVSLHDFETADKTIEHFLNAHPESATAHAQRAIYAAATQNGSAGIDPLQDALDLLQEEMPLRVLEAIGAVGQALLVEGKLIAARGHLVLYASITPEEDNRALELLMRLNLQGGLPLLLRESLDLSEPPSQAAWKEEYEQAIQLSARGAWRKAAELLIATIKKHGREPALVYSLALLQGWLGNTDAFAAGLHKFAKFAVPLDDAIEAEALAQLIDPVTDEPKIETVRLSYEIVDEEKLEGVLAKDRRVEDYQLDPSAEAEDESTRPRSSHILLDRDSPKTGENIQREEIPHIVGFMSLFGKRTDRTARFEVTGDRGEGIRDIQEFVQEVLGEALGELQDTEVVAEKPLGEEALSWRWRLPDDTPLALRRELLAQQRRTAILDKWADSPRGALGNKSPHEAAGDETLRIPLLASLLIVEQSTNDPDELQLFAELREKLGIAQPDIVEPQDVDLQVLPLVRMPRLNLAALSAKQLAELQERTVLMGANLATILIAEQLVTREDLPEDFDLAPSYGRLIRLLPDPESVGPWIEKARAWSKSREESEAQWALLELETAIQRGDAESVQACVGEIRDKHMNEPGVSEEVYRLLYAAGLIDPTRMAGQAPPTAGEPVGVGTPAGDGPAIWTPGGDAAAGPSSDDDKPTIWTP